MVNFSLSFVLSLGVFVEYAQASTDDVPTSNHIQIQKLLNDIRTLPDEKFNERIITKIRLVYAYEEAGHSKLARENAKELEEYLTSENVTERVKAYSLYRILNAHAKEGNYEKALSILEAYRQSATKETEVMRRYATTRALSELYDNLGYHERSAALMEEGLTVPEFFDLRIFKDDKIANHILLGNQYLKLRQPDLAYEKAASAQRYTDEILETNPDASRYVLGIMGMDIDRIKIEGLMATGEYFRAAEKLETLIETAEVYDRIADLNMAKILKAKICIEKGRFEDAIEILESVINDSEFDITLDGSLEALLYYSIALEATGRISEALEYRKLEQFERTALENQRVGMREAFVTAEIENSAKRERLQELETEKTLAEVAERKANFISLLSVIAAFFAMIALAVSFRSLRNQKKARLKIQNYAESLKISETEARKNAEKALAASEAKSSFLANMSHEIRTPMNGILGMAQILAGSGLKSQQKEFVKIIQSSGEALLTIINDILDFSKIEAGKLELDPVKANLRLAIEDVMSMLATRAASKRLELLVRFDPGLPIHVIADMGRIRQVLVNIVGNAIKFTESGYVLLNISGTEQSGRAQLNFEILDTGIGIPANRVDTIFEEFNQAENSTTRRFGGTGLGLSITKRLIEAMGGTISVKSRYGKGSIFTFNLSLALSNQSERQTAVQTLTDTHVMIVSELALTRKIISEQLEHWSTPHRAVSSGQAAIDALIAAAREDRPYECVIFDYDMQNMDIYAFTETIRSNPLIKDVRIISLYLPDENEDVEKLRTLDADDYIMKPAKQSRLLEGIVGQRSIKAPVINVTDSIHPKSDIEKENALSFANG